MRGGEDGLTGITDALMDLVALTGMTIELEAHLTGGLLRSYRGVDGEESQARQTGDGTFQTVGVFNHLTQHLVASTDAYHHLSFTVSVLDGLSTTVTTQFQEVVKGSFRTWQDDDVRLLDVLGVTCIEEVHTRVALQGVEIGEVADMSEQHHCHVDLALSQLTLFLFETDTVFFIDIDILEVGNHAQDGYATEVFEHLPTFLKETHISTELVDDDTLDAFPVFYGL